MKNTGFRYVVMSFLLWGLVCFCGKKERVDNLAVEYGTHMFSDSAYVVLSANNQENILRYDTLRHKYDSIMLLNDSLRIKLFLAQYKVEKVGFYLKIVDRKPSQAKFLKGWVRRAIE